MKVKNSRLETLKMLISSQELSSQEQLLQALHKEGFQITQATLSRDLKLLKVAKAASSSGKYACQTTPCIREFPILHLLPR